MFIIIFHNFKSARARARVCVCVCVWKRMM